MLKALVLDRSQSVAKKPEAEDRITVKIIKIVMDFLDAQKM